MCLPSKSSRRRGPACLRKPQVRAGREAATSYKDAASELAVTDSQDFRLSQAVRSTHAPQVMRSLQAQGPPPNSVVGESVAAIESSKVAGEHGAANRDEVAVSRGGAPTTQGRNHLAHASHRERPGEATGGCNPTRSRGGRMRWSRWVAASHELISQAIGSLQPSRGERQEGGRKASSGRAPADCFHGVAPRQRADADRGIAARHHPGQPRLHPCTQDCQATEPPVESGRPAHVRRKCRTLVSALPKPNVCRIHVTFMSC